jgi:hypothetical protein
MANGFESLRKLADVLNVETARISGDPQRLQLALGETQARKLQETESALNQAIDASDIPESQKRLLKALDYQSKAKMLYEAQKPKEPMTEKQKYDELAAQIKQEIALRGRGSAAFDKQQGGNPNLLEFYDTYIVGGNIDPFKAALAGLFGQNNGATPPPSQKSYKVIGASYSGQSADKVIQNAMTVNPGMSKEKVIQNLIAQGIISEG